MLVITRKHGIGTKKPSYGYRKDDTFNDNIRTLLHIYYGKSKITKKKMKKGGLI